MPDVELNGLSPEELQFREEAVRQIAEAKNQGKEHFLRIVIAAIQQKAARALLKIKERFRKTDDKSDPHALKNPLDGALTDDGSEKNNIVITQVHIAETIKAFQENSNLIPGDESTVSGKILRNLVRRVQPNEITHLTAPYIYKIVEAASRNVITAPLEALDDEELKQLYRLDSSLGDKVVESLMMVEEQTPPGLVKLIQDRIKSQIQVANPTETLNALSEEGQTEESRQFSASVLPFADPEYQLPQGASGNIENSYFGIGRSFRNKDDHNLLAALYSPYNFNIYVGKMIAQIPGYTHTPGTPLPREHAIAISEQIEERVTLLMGKLYMEIDRASPKVFTSEAEQKGGPFENTKLYADALEKQLSIMQNNDYSGLTNLQDVAFYRKQGLTFDERIETKPYFPEHTDPKKRIQKTDKERYVIPVYNNVQISVKQFFNLLENSADDEVSLRKFEHDAIALYFQPKPEQGGYYSQLARFAKTHFTSSSLDSLAHLPDHRMIRAAAQLQDKMLEADMASFNWIHKPTLFQLGMNTKRNVRDDLTVDYLNRLFPDIAQLDSPDDPLSNWRIRRAAQMGLGDNYTLSLKALEHGARADSPRILEFGNAEDIASYGINDHNAYMAFNPFNHFNLRYSMRSTLIGDLLFLPVEGKDVQGGRFGNFSRWDHRSVMKKMQMLKNAWVNGRDTDENTMLIDYANIGRVGSIYTRTGGIGTHASWRKRHFYEGYTDGAGEHHSVVGTWKNIENVGIEVLVDYVNRIGSYQEHFYHDNDHGRHMRKDLFDHVYRRYFRDPGKPPSSVSQSLVDAEFARLEKHSKPGDHGKALSKAYKEFYYKAIVRGMRQRIPTKFIRYERSREVVGRKRAWEWVLEEVNKTTAMDDTQYMEAAQDLFACESRERMHATDQLNEAIDMQSHKDAQGNYTAASTRKLHEYGEIDYELTEEKIRGYLQSMNLPQDRIDRAVAVYKGIYTFTEDRAVDNGQFLDRFAKKYEKDRFPFSMASDEVETSLLTYRAAGEDMPQRAFQDIANIEEKVSNVFINYFEKLKTVAANGKLDFSPLVHDLETAKQQLLVDIGEDQANKFVHHMASVTIQYFKKDFVSQRWYLKPFVWGRKASIAAEFGGQNRGIWEWGAKDVDNFIAVLEAEELLPKDPYEPNHEPHYEEVRWKIPFTKKSILMYKKRLDDIEWYGGKLRKEFGASNAHLALEIVDKYLPILGLFLLYTYISQALKESNDD